MRFQFSFDEWEWRVVKGGGWKGKGGGWKGKGGWCRV